MKAISLIAFGLAPLLAATPVFASDDGIFIKEAMKGDSSEVALGELAEKQGASPRTREYGRMLVHDHGAHRRKLAVLGTTFAVAPTFALSDDGARARTKLQGLHGKEFDAAFKEDMIKDHDEDIARYEAEARSAQTPRVRSMAQETLPTLRKHLAEAKAL